MPPEEDITTGTDASTTGGETTPAETVDQLDYQNLYTQAQAEAADWKKRFTGLQGSYQREQQKWKTDTTRLTELDSLVKGFDDERTSLKTQIDELLLAQGELEVLKASHERIGIIAKEFPDLLDMEADGLLPDDTGDDLRKKLTAMRTRLQAVGKTAIQDNLKGAVPPTTSGDAPKGKEELNKARIKAFTEGNIEEYERLTNEYFQQV